MTDKHRRVLYAYGPQRTAVLADLDMIIRECPDIRFIEDAQQVYGIENGIFINIANHGRQPGAHLWETLKVMGFTVIAIDDSYRRGRFIAQHAPGQR